MKKLKLLIIEDIPENALFYASLLESEGYEITYTLVDTADGMQKALETQEFDIALVDYVLPNFDGLQALKILRNRDSDMPAIVISAALGEKMAVKVMKAGANDYIPKANMGRLSLVIERELKEAANRKTKKNIEKELLESKQRFEIIFNEAPFGICIFTLSGILVNANKMAAKIFKINEKNKVLGLKFPIFFEKEVEKRLLNGESYVFEYTFDFDRLKNTYQIPISETGIHQFEITISLIKILGETYYIAYFQDITRKKEIESLFHLNEKRLESLFKISNLQELDTKKVLDVVLEEIIALSESEIGYVYYYDEETKNFTHSACTQSENFTFTLQTHFHLENAGLVFEVIKNRIPLIINDYENYKSLDRRGLPQEHFKIIRFLSIPVVGKGKIVAVVGVANKKTNYSEVDVRQLYLLMDSVWEIIENKIMQQELIRSKEQAEESNRLKSVFLMNISHEIRTPMNAILGFSQLLSIPGITDEKKQFFMRIITANTNALLDLMENIIDISLLETHQLHLQQVDFSVNGLMQELFLECNEKISEMSKNLEIRCPNLYDIYKINIFTDRIRLKQILSNLLRNAIKFTEMGFVEFGFRILGDELLEFYVLDTGIGITLEKQKIIFDSFRQADEGTTRKFGGMGLGLAISKKLVELMKGQIYLKSKENEGATFYFTIPCKFIK